MSTKIVNLPGIGNVTLSKNQRSKRIKLSVRASQKILVSFPPYSTFSEAASFAQKHKEWINKQQHKLLEKSEKSIPETPFQTRFHTVNIQSVNDKFSVQQKKFDITIFYPQQFSRSDAEVQSFITRVMDSVYKWEARKYLPGRIAELSEQHNLAFNKLSIRNNRTNWGSCSSRNNISLNQKLMKLPDYLIDFILLHELAHTKVKNHGPGFWKLLDELSGGKAKELTKEVKNYKP